MFGGGGGGGGQCLSVFNCGSQNLYVVQVAAHV